MKKVFTVLFSAGLASGLSACATIVNSDYVTVPVYTNPSGATVRVLGQTYVTPTQVLLPRGKGGFSLEIEKEGYNPANITLHQSLDGWLLGNLFLTSWIGLAVDLISGDGFDLEPEIINQTLTPMVARTTMMSPAGNNNAEPLTLLIRKNFDNESWYPLPEKEMVAAITDSALGELTTVGRFRFVNETDTAGKEKIGYVNFDVSLIESIETVKLTITLQTPEGATFVATGSEVLANKDRLAIYEAFQSVADKTAKDLNGKIFR